MWRGVLAEGGCGVQSSEFVRAGRDISYLGLASYLMGLLISGLSHMQVLRSKSARSILPRGAIPGGGGTGASSGPSTGRIYISQGSEHCLHWEGPIGRGPGHPFSKPPLDRAQGVRTWPVLRGHLSQWATRSILSHRAAYPRGACPEASNPRGRLLAHALPTSWRVGLWLTAR